MLMRYYFRVSRERARAILARGLDESSDATAEGLQNEDEDRLFPLYEQAPGPDDYDNALMQVDLELSDAEHESFRMVSDNPNLLSVNGESMVPLRLIKAKGEIRRVTSYYLMRNEEVLESIDDPDDEIKDPLSGLLQWIRLHLGNTKDGQERGLHLWCGDLGGDTLIAAVKKGDDGGWVLEEVSSDRH